MMPNTLKRYLRPILAAPVALGLLFVAATEDVHKTRLTPQLLSSQSKLEAILNRLPAPERKLFSSYVMSHRMSSVIPALMSSSQNAVTVGDAIRIVKTRNAIIDEENKALAPLDAHIAKLKSAMEAADYAPAPTEAYNTAVAERDKVQSAYHDKLDAVK